MLHITFIHGIANKPEEKKLKKIWLDALENDLLHNDDGIALETIGITTSMIYWADVLYDKPMEEALLERAGSYESNVVAALNEDSDPDMSWREHLTGSEKEITDALAAKFSFDMLMNDDATPKQNEIANTLERIPLPWFVKRRLMKWLLKDVHHYLFNYEFSPRPGTTYKVQDEIRNRVKKELKRVQDTLNDSGEPSKHIIISHSMGTVIMYDCLKRMKDCPAIDGIITIGSPLGIDEIQDKFKPEWSRANGYPEKLNGEWINIYDALDPVAGFDGNIANDYKKNGEEIIEVINEQNWGPWRHNITNYLSGPKLRHALRSILNL